MAVAQDPEAVIEQQGDQNGGSMEEDRSWSTVNRKRAVRRDVPIPLSANEGSARNVFDWLTNLDNANMLLIIQG